MTKCKHGFWGSCVYLCVCVHARTYVHAGGGETYWARNNYGAKQQFSSKDTPKILWDHRRRNKDICWEERFLTWRLTFEVGFNKGVRGQ